MKQKITWILNDFIGKELTNWYYYTLDLDGAASNEKGIDIVPMGVELVFLNGKSFILSWDVSKITGVNYCINIFNNYTDVFNPSATIAKVQKKHSYWEELLSNVFTKYTIYGYEEVRNQKKEEIPILIVFTFSEKSVGIIRISIFDVVHFLQFLCSTIPKFFGSVCYFETRIELFYTEGRGFFLTVITADDTLCVSDGFSQFEYNAGNSLCC